jgi:hypothetical protein
MAPFVSLLWRIRRKLADATAVQLTRYPGALAQAYRTLAALDMKVPGAVAVHFLFPVWDPAVDKDNTRPEVTSLLLHMQLPLGPRLRRLERLGAGSADAPLAIPDPGLTWREIAAGAGWIACGVVLLGLAVALSVLGAAGVLYAVGWLLHGVLGLFQSRPALS